MADVHPTAIVDSQAELDGDVVVGAGCVIEGPVTIRSGTRLLPRVCLRGPLTIGTGNLLFPNVCVGFAAQHTAYDQLEPTKGVVIGNNNVLREGATIHGATAQQPTTIGDDNFLMVNAHIGHDVQMGNSCTLVNGTLVGGHVTIADQAILSGNSVVHQFCRIGRLAMMSGVRGITKDLPTFCVVHHMRRVGYLNLVGLRRAGYRQHIKPLERAFDLLYRQGHMVSRALEHIRQELADDPLCMELCEFVAASKRGITPYGGTDDPLRFE